MVSPRAKTSEPEGQGSGTDLGATIVIEVLKSPLPESIKNIRDKKNPKNWMSATQRTVLRSVNQNREHSNLNRGLLDLQSNVLTLSYALDICRKVEPRNFWRLTVDVNIYCDSSVFSFPREFMRSGRYVVLGPRSWSESRRRLKIQTASGPPFLNTVQP